MSILAPVRTSLTATGCRLSVGELAGTTTSTLSRTNVSRISTSTCSVSPGLTPNGAESVSANPSRTAWTTYRPGATSGNVTWPTPSLVVFPTTMLPSTLRSSTVTAGIRSPSTTIVTMTRAGPEAAGCCACESPERVPWNEPPPAAETVTWVSITNAIKKDAAIDVNEHDGREADDGVRRSGKNRTMPSVLRHTGTRTARQ